MGQLHIPSQQRLILDNITWERYTQLLRMFSDRHLRMTYDRGFLEIMTLSSEHEGLAEFLNWLILILVQELKLSIKLGGSTTFRKKRKQKGLEPDKCYWIAHASDVRGKKKIDLRKDPPPDLAVEIDITHSSLNRMRIYANLRIPEVWRYDAQGLTFLSMTANRTYDPVATSSLFSLPLTPADLMTFIQMRDKMDEDVIIEQFRRWIQSKIAGTSQP